MNLELDVSIDFTLRDGDKIVVTHRLLDALATIAHCGSIQRAASELDVSYRHLWGQIKDAEVRLGQPLVHLERGRGSNLAPLAEAILAERNRAVTTLAGELTRVKRDAETALRRHLNGSETALHVRASHDLAIEHLPDLARRAGIDLKLGFGGSRKNLQALAQGRCMLAGVHMPLGAIGRAMLADFHRVMPAPQAWALRVMERTQGLIVAPGNPLGLSGLADLVRSKASFINRQANSGTRALFDALLHEAGLAPTAVRGYGHEELTHFAVAAAVAAGAVDAAFGLQAAAQRLGLDFVPIARERYFFVCRDELLQTPPLAALIDTLRSPAFTAICESLGGYSTEDVGTLHSWGAPPLD